MKKRLFALFMAVITATTATTIATETGTIYAAEQEESTEELVEGDYTYTVTDDCATIMKYTGSEEHVVTPTMLGGYPVTEIGEYAFSENTMTKATVSEGIVRVGAYAFWNCSNLQELELSSSVQVIGYGGTADTTELLNIMVSKQNKVFFDEDGVLFKRVEEGIILYTYPAGKSDIAYKVPAFCSSLQAWSLCDVQNLKSLHIPDTVKKVHNRILCSAQYPVDVYMNHNTIPYVSAEMFFDMPSGCHVIVKNEECKNALEQIDIFAKGQTYETKDSSVIVLGSEGYPAIPTTSLTWDGTSTEGTHTLSPAEKCQLTYVQEPFNSTDNITWTSSDEKIARVNAVTGVVEASGGVNYPLATGTCTITGTSERGHNISVDVTVYEPISSMDLYCEEYNPETYCMDISDESKWIRVDAKPFTANNAFAAEWDSSNTIVATIEKDTEDKRYALITVHAPGTTTITATLNDNGTIWTRSFELTVTKSISDCTVSAIADQTYTGQPQTPDVTVMDGTKELVKGIDYEVTYTNNTLPGFASAMITGKGLYTDSKNVYFNIVKTNAGGNGSDTGSTGNTGNSGSTGTTGNNGNDSANNGSNTNSNSATGNNTGNTAGSNVNQNTLKEQKITAKNIYTKTYGEKAFFLNAKASGKISYTSGNKKVAIVDKNSGRVVLTGTGKCIITVTAATTSEYKQAETAIAIYVSPKQAAVKSVKSTKKAQLTVKWKKDTKVTGYELQYSTSRKFSKKKTVTVTVKSNKKVSKVIKGLKSGKKYYVRVRGYKKVKVAGNKKATYMGSYSVVKNAVVK